MSITPKNKSSKTVSERERFIGFVLCLPCLLLSQEPVDLFFSSMQGHATSSPIK